MNTQLLEYWENGCIQRIHSRIEKLKREAGQEVLYTHCGLRILLRNLHSLNGIVWE